MFDLWIENENWSAGLLEHIPGAFIIMFWPFHDFEEFG